MFILLCEYLTYHGYFGYTEYLKTSQEADGQGAWSSSSFNHVPRWIKGLILISNILHFGYKIQIFLFILLTKIDFILVVIALYSSYLYWYGNIVCTAKVDMTI